MAKFTLQRVLDLKKRREQALAIRLAHARSRAEEARCAATEIETLRHESDAIRLELAARPGSVGSLQNAAYVRERMDHQLEVAIAAARAAEAEVEECLSAFTLALQERQVLDRLKEKRMEAEQIEEGRQEQAKTDATALSRFFRREEAKEEGA